MCSKKGYLMCSKKGYTNNYQYDNPFARDAERKNYCTPVKIYASPEFQNVVLVVHSGDSKPASTSILLRPYREEIARKKYRTA